MCSLLSVQSANLFKQNTPTYLTNSSNYIADTAFDPLKDPQILHLN